MDVTGTKRVHPIRTLRVATDEEIKTFTGHTGAFIDKMFDFFPVMITNEMDCEEILDIIYIDWQATIKDQ